MHYRDHNPPHFHALYAGKEAQISIEALELMNGSLPARATRLTFEWAALHKDELAENWRLREQEVRLKPIEPLE